MIDKIMGTGSRVFLLLDREERDRIYEDLRQYLLMRHKENKRLLIISGGAEGWDEALATIAMREGIDYFLALPNEVYADYYWRRKSITNTDRIATIQELIDHATHVEYICGKDIYSNGVHANFVRNTWMVERCDEAVVYDADSRGTIDAVKKLMKAKKPYKVFS